MHLTRRNAMLAVALAVLCVPSAAAAAGPAAVIDGIDCELGGAAVTLSNESGGPMRFTILRGEEAIATAVLPAGARNVRRVVPIAEGAAAQVTVRHGASYVSSLVRRSCDASATAAPESAAATARAADAAPFAAAPVASTSGAAGTTATPLPAVAALPQGEPTGADDVVTIDDGTATWPWVVAGIAALAALALVLGLRLRPRASEQQPEPAAPPRA